MNSEHEPGSEFDSEFEFEHSESGLEPESESDSESESESDSESDADAERDISISTANQFELLYESGDLTGIKLLYEMNPSIDLHGRYFIEACRYGWTHICTWMYDIGLFERATDCDKHEAMISACFSGNLAMVVWVYDYIDEFVDLSDIFASIGLVDAPAISKWLVSLQIDIANLQIDNIDATMPDASAEDIESAISDIVEVSVDMLRQVFDDACESGRLKRAKWVVRELSLQNKIIMSLTGHVAPRMHYTLVVQYATTDAFISVCNSGNLKMAKWMLAHNPQLSADLFDCDVGINLSYICACGNVKLVKWLFRKQTGLPLYIVSRAIHQAITAGHVLTVMWLFAHITLYDRSEETISAEWSSWFTQSVASGHLNLVKLCVSHFTPKYEMIQQLITTADQPPLSDDLVRWVLDYFTPPISATMFCLLFRHKTPCSAMYAIECAPDIVSDSNVIANVPLMYLELIVNQHHAFAKWTVETFPFILTVLGAAKPLDQTPSVFEKMTDAFCELCRNGHVADALLLIRINPAINIRANHDVSFVTACQNHDYPTATYLQSLLPNVYTLVQTAPANKTDGFMFNIAIERYRGHIIVETCSVCYETDSNLVTQCAHQYCAGCLIKWMSRNKSCPICRSDISHSTCRSIGTPD